MLAMERVGKKKAKGNGKKGKCEVIARLFILKKD